MFFKELLDGLPIFAQLLFHGFEGGDQRQGQAALGAGNGFSSTKLLRPGEEAQALLVGLGTSESVGVQELFPAAFAGFAQGLGSGKALDKVPGAFGRPIVKGFQSRWIVFRHGTQSAAASKQ